MLVYSLNNTILERYFVETFFCFFSFHIRLQLTHLTLPAKLANMINIRRIARLIFNCCCAVFAFYMTIKQFDAYFKNEDESVISFEELSETSPDEFATYTLCFVDNHQTGLYKHDELSDDDTIDHMFSYYFLKPEDNKLILKNNSNLKDRYNFLSLYNVNDPDYEYQGRMNLYDPVTNYFYCGTGEPVSSDIIWNDVKVTHEGCGEIEDHVQTYVRNLEYPWSHNGVMLIEKNGKTYVIRNRQYQDLLLGSNAAYKLEHECFNGTELVCEIVPIKYSLEDTKNLEFDERTVDMELFLLDYEVKAANGSEIGWSSEIYQQIIANRTLPMKSKQSAYEHQNSEKQSSARKLRSISNPLIKVYQDPKKKCYTPFVDSSLRKKEERVTLDLTEITNQFGRAWDGSPVFSPLLEVHVHQQGQFLRSIGKELASYSTGDLVVYCHPYGFGVFDGTCYGSSLKLVISEVSLLTSRHDAESPCDKNLIDEDTKILETVLNKTGIRCIPMYWKSIIKNGLNYSECNTELQYQMIARAIANFTSFEMLRSSFNPPCKEMIIVTNVEKDPGRKVEKYNVKDAWDDFDEKVYLDISIGHAGKRYQKISNTRGFTGESLWAGIGGFLGIFVGISLMQVPEILIETINSIQKLKEYVSKKR